LRDLYVHRHIFEDSDTAKLSSVYSREHFKTHESCDLNNAKSYLKVFGKALTQWWGTYILPWAA